MKDIETFCSYEPEFIDGDVDLRINIYRRQNGVNGDNVTKNVTIDTNETNETKLIALISSGWNCSERKN